MVGESCLNLIISVWINVSTSQKPPHKGYEKKGVHGQSGFIYHERRERDRGPKDLGLKVGLSLFLTFLAIYRKPKLTRLNYAEVIVAQGIYFPACVFS